MRSRRFHAPCALDHGRYAVYGMLYTVRRSTTLISVQLTRAGVSEGKASQKEGSFSGSTSTRHLKAERCQRPRCRRSVVGGPPRSGYLLARAEPPGRSAIRSRRSRLERLPVRELGIAACLGQGPLRALFQVVDDDRVQARGAAQRHPRRNIRPANFHDGGPNHRRRSSQFRLLARGGDVRGDVGPKPDGRPDEDGGSPATRWELEDEDPPIIRRSSTEGDVQGDVVYPCCSRCAVPTAWPVEVGRQRELRPRTRR